MFGRSEGLAPFGGGWVGVGRAVAELDSWIPPEGRDSYTS